MYAYPYGTLTLSSFVKKNQIPFLYALTLIRPLRRKLRMRCFVDVSKVADVIHTNKPLITSFYIKKVLIFAELAMSQR